MAAEAVTTLDAEVAVAGSILIDPDCYFRISTLLTAESFQIEPCRSIFKAAEKLAANGTALDPQTVLKQLRAMGCNVSSETLAQYIDVTPTAANAELYAEIVADHAKRRALLEIAQNAVEDNMTPTDELLAWTFSAVENLTQQNTRQNCADSASMLCSFFQALEDRTAGKKNFVPSGYRQLDEILGGGFLNGGLYIIAARPGMGKTTFALNLADRICGNVLFISLEMSEDQLTAKRVSRITGIPSNRLLMGAGLTQEEFARIAEASAELSKSGVYVNKSMTATVANVGVLARGIKGLKAVVVDYLGLVQPERKGSRYDVVTEISGALKRLARSLNVPVLALSQLSRANESRNDKRPMLSDLRESGAIEQDADAVLMLYREDYYDKEKQLRPWEPSLIECNVAKNRHAATGKVWFNGYLATCRIFETT